ncbi:L,D-transpeptidase family protein [Thioalkalicoccus limnaeus]|uniref:L,D-transpeptidase family protein n=1 Tax=Thioalkalicoccus limnaeus TaxID=120681 RepID=A0ABV4BC04_9GAMM
MSDILHTHVGMRSVVIGLLAGLIGGCASLPWPGSGEGLSSSATESSEAADPASTASTDPPPTASPPDVAPAPLYEWGGDGRRISRIVINTDEQKAIFYDGDTRIGWSTVATGTTSHPTPTGRFEIMERTAEKRSNLYGTIYDKAGRVVKTNARQGRDRIPAGGRFVGAEMPFFLRLTYDGVGLHAGPIPRPGHPASHGCIRLPKKLAPVVFRKVSHGTPVIIEGSGPSYGDYAEQVRAEARERERVAAAEAREMERAEAAQASRAVADRRSEAGRSDATLSPAAQPRPAVTDQPPVAGEPEVADKLVVSDQPVDELEPATTAIAVDAPPVIESASFATSGDGPGRVRQNGRDEPADRVTDEPAEAAAGEPERPVEDAREAAPASDVAVPVSPDAAERYGP